MAATDKVRKAVPEDLSQISTALSRAFLDDPVMSWAIPDEQRRQRILPDFFSLYTEVFLRHDESYTTREEVIGAALWAPPGRLPVSGEDAEDFGRRMEEMAGVDAPRFLEVGKLVDDYHPHGSYYYLQFLGVAPGRQGQGIGAALMAPVLERCDREGMRAYLEAIDPQLLPASQEDREVLLDVFLLEQAVYQLGHELRTRPAWVGIPLRDLRSLLASPDPVWNQPDA